MADAGDVLRIVPCRGRRWALEDLLIFLVLGSLLSSVGQITASSTILRRFHYIRIPISVFSTRQNPFLVVISIEPDASVLMVPVVGELLVVLAAHAVQLRRP